MTPTTTPARSILEDLRGDRSERPPRDIETAAGLRATLDAELLAIRSVPARTSPLVISASDVTHHGDAVDITHATSGRLRGALIGQLIRLVAVGHEIIDPFDDALRAWRLDSPSPTLIAAYADLDANGRARLATDVAAHAASLRRALADVPSAWAVRTAVRARVPLAGGVVVLHDVVDLVVGSYCDASSSTVLLDVTTSPIGRSATSLLGFHAFVHCLRTSVVPLRVAIFSTATGELISRDVDETWLELAANDVLDVARRA